MNKLDNYKVSVVFFSCRHSLRFDFIEQMHFNITQRYVVSFVFLVSGQYIVT